LVSRATPRPKRFAQQPVLQRVVVVPRDCSCAATSAIPSDKYRLVFAAGGFAIQPRRLRWSVPWSSRSPPPRPR